MAQRWDYGKTGIVSDGYRIGIALCDIVIINCQAEIMETEESVR